MNKKSKEISKVGWHCFDDVDESFINQVKQAVKEAGLIYDADFKIIKY